MIRSGLALVLAISLTALTCPVQAAEPRREQTSKSAEPGTTTGSRFTPMAQQFLEAARAKRDEQLRLQREQEAAAKRRQAQRVAMDMAQQKTKQRQATQRQAQQQVVAARERQLKALYQEGLRLYRAGHYQEAVDQLQKLALLEPGHPLVKSAGQLIARAELKQVERKARVAASSGANVPDAMVSELEKLLTEKRIEQETLLRYAKTAIRDRQYDTAIELLYRVLNQDPTSRQAQVLLEQARMAKLDHEEQRLASEVDIDEQAMMNEVLKAEQLPPDESRRRKPSALPVGGVTADSRAAVLAKLNEPISFDFKEVSLADVLDFVSDAANVSIIPSPRLDLKQQQVSLRVDKLPLEMALKYLMKHQGLAYRIEEGVILIASQEEFASEPLETRVMMLRSGLGPFALETAAIESNPALAMDSLKTLLLPPRRSERSFPRAVKIKMSNYPRKRR
jgi:tetratricopeptide (TPR) repeat protein